jgi:uncharacterized protein (DUF885 family)
MRYARVYFCFLLLITGPFSLLLAQQENFTSFCSAFIKGYDELSIPATELDYKSNFNNIPGNEALAGQEDFFRSCSKKLELVNKKDLNKEELLRYAQLSYELSLNMERIALEKKWNDEGRKVPEDGLHSMSNYKEWYSYLVRYFTSVNISPEQVFEMGSSEVKKIQKEILTIQHTLGYTNENDFYKSLKNDTFYYSDKKQILAGYAKIDHTVRKNLKNLFLPNEINEIGVMEWPNAGPNTPPGIYLSKRDNAYGKDVFQYNFYGSKHNKRAMEWLYMHEGIPGHHLQSEVRRKTKGSELQNQFFYFGNAEGWACYIEDLGKEMGLYQNPYTYLGKWEWDLVRSARLVMEVGIHYYGWSHEKALAYWKENIKGQDEIAEREISRITKWAGQALCYKVGALTIKNIITKKTAGGEDIKKIHQFLLSHSDVPLQVITENS